MASPTASTAPVGSESLCDLRTTEDVSTALDGETISEDKAAGSFTDLAAALLVGDDTTGPLPDLIRQNFPDAVELEVGGVPALRTPTQAVIRYAKGWKQSTLYVFPDPLTMLQLQAAAPKGVDGGAAESSRW